jgi:prophage regulatory protein
MKMLRLPEVIEMTGLSRMTIYRYEAKGEFPKRRRLGVNAVGWLEDEVNQWMQSRPSASVTPDVAAVFLSRPRL